MQLLQSSSKPSAIGSTGKTQAVDTVNSTKSSKLGKSGRGPAHERVYVEEVDVETIPANTTKYRGSASIRAYQGNEDTDDDYDNNEYQMTTTDTIDEDLHPFRNITSSSSNRDPMTRPSNASNSSMAAHPAQEKASIQSNNGKSYSFLRSSRASSTAASTRYSSSAEDNEEEDYMEGLRNMHDEEAHSESHDSVRRSSQSNDSYKASIAIDYYNGSISGGIASSKAPVAQASVSSTGRYHLLQAVGMKSATSTGGDGVHMKDTHSLPSTTNSNANGHVAATTTNSNKDRSEEVLADGSKLIRYRNGTVKELHVDGSSLVRFTNGDTKLTNPDSGVVVYYYAQADTTHTTYADGLEVYQFPNKQVLLSAVRIHMHTVPYAIGYKHHKHMPMHVYMHAYHMYSVQ